MYKNRSSKSLKSELQVNFVQKLEPQTGSADPAILFSLGFPKVQQAGLIIFNASILRRCVACDACGGGARGTFYTSHNFPVNHAMFDAARQHSRHT